MHRWYLPTPGEIIASTDPGVLGDDTSAQAIGQWYGAVAALNELLRELVQESMTIQADTLLPQEGVILSGPFPVLRDPQLMQQFSSWSFAGNWATSLRKQLPSTAASNRCQSSTAISLLAGDPLATESFYLVLTAEFSLTVALTQVYPTDQQASPVEPRQALAFSFDPTVVSQCWQSLRTRIKLTNPGQLAHLDPLIQQFTPRAPDYQLVTRFSRKLLTSFASAASSSRPNPHTVEHIGKPRGSVPVGISQTSAEPNRWHNTAAVASSGGERDVASAPDSAAVMDAPLYSYEVPSAGSDTEILKAIAHEVRTPLSTIRTLTRSLLRRRDLPAQVTKRLGMIDRECTRQIERFGLIFRAVELETETHRTAGPLAKISLEDLFQKNLQRWRQQAEERDLTLDVGWTNALPTVLSDPAMLDQMLTGLIDRVTHALPAGSHIQLRVIPAGDQLKLQLYSRTADSAASGSSSDDAKTTCPQNSLFSLFSPSLGLKSIGQLLMFQPETGNVSLNLDITKTLFQSLGGKFTIRHSPQQGEVVTIFLPLERAEAS